MSSSEFGISTSSWIGGSGGLDAAMGVRIQSDGTIVMAVNLSDAVPGDVTPSLLNGSTSSVGGAVVRLDSAGRQVLSVARLCSEVREIELDPDDNIYVAGAESGVFKLNPTADQLIWSALSNESDFVAHRLDVSHDGVDPSRHGYVAVLSPSTSEVYGKAGPGTIYLLSPSGLVLNQFPGRSQHCQDIAIHGGEQIIIGIGYSNISTWTTDLGNGTPVDIPWMNAWRWDHDVDIDSRKWTAYGWSASAWKLDSEGNPLYDQRVDENGIPETDENGQPVYLPWLGNDSQPVRDQNGDPLVDENGDPYPRRIPNERWINFPFDPNRPRLLSDGSIQPDTMTNNMADTRGNRVTIGDDGLLYALYEFDGGNTPLRAQSGDLGSINYIDDGDPNSRVVADYTSANAPFAGGSDPHDSLYNTSTVPKVFYLKHEVSTGTVINSNALVNRLSSGDDNTVRSRYGDIAADVNGQVYIGGDSAYGLPILFNNDTVPSGDSVTFNPFGPGSYTGGAWFMTVSPDFSQREYLTRLTTATAGIGQTFGVAGRVLTGESEARIAWVGRTHSASLLFREQALQNNAGSGASQGFFAVLGGDVGGGSISSLTQLDWVDPDLVIGGKLRDSDEEESGLLDLDGDGQFDDREYYYPFRDDIPLSPSGSSYSGPVFKGGIRSRVFDGGSHTFDAKVTDTGVFNYRSQPGGGALATQHGVWYVERDQFRITRPTDGLSFGASSFLKIQDQFPTNVYRWLVRNGDQFYVSEELIASDAMLTFTTDTNDGSWAEFNPAMEGLNFDAESAVFEDRNFRDITAVGFIIDKDVPGSSRFFLRMDRFVASLAPSLIENQPPIADFTISKTPIAIEDSTTITSLSTDQEGDIDALIWDLDDGSAASGAQLTHSYFEAGTFTIRHTIRDSSLVSDSIEKPLVVSTSRPTTDPTSTLAAWGGKLSGPTNIWTTATPTAVDADGDGEVDDIREEKAFSMNSLPSQAGRVPFRSAWVGENLDASYTNGRLIPKAANGTTVDSFDLRYQPGNGAVRMHALFWFDKDDFFNGKDNGAVGATFSPEDTLSINGFSRLESLTSRWVVRDGDQWFVSEDVNTTTINPADGSRWAEYQPGNQLNFDQNTAIYSIRNFRNVTAAGLYIEQDEFGISSRLWVNFRNLEIVATGAPFYDYQLWATTRFGADVLNNPALESSIWGAAADPDGDGIANLSAWVTGLPENGAYQSTTRHNRFDEGTFQATFEHILSPNGVTVIPEWSFDRQTWFRTGISTLSAIDLADPLRPGVHAVTYGFDESREADEFYVRLAVEEL